MHSFFVFLTLTAMIVVFGGILLSKVADKKTLGRLKLYSAVTFIFVLVLMFTGIIPDMVGYANGFTYTTINQYANTTVSVSNAQVGNFTGPYLFDMMEHVTQIGPALAAVVMGLIWYLGPQVITQPQIRRGVLVLLGLGWVWLIALGAIGIILTKTITLPPWM